MAEDSYIDENASENNFGILSEKPKSNEKISSNEDLKKLIESDKDIFLVYNEKNDWKMLHEMITDLSVT